MVAVAAACYTLQDLENRECRALCRHTGDGHDGVRIGNKCRCFDDHEYAALQEKRFVLRTRKPKAPNPAPTPTYRWGWSDSGEN